MKKLLIFIILAIGILDFSLNYALADEAMTNSDRARFGLARSLVSKARYDEAAEILTDLHSRYPEDRDISLTLAQALGYGLKLDEAMALLDELKKRFPDDRDIQYTYANIFEANQHFNEARKNYAVLLEKEPHNRELLSKIADVSSWMGDYETAIEYYRSLIEEDKEDASLKMKLADAFLWSKNYSDAIRLYKEIGVKPETDRKRFKNLGDAYLGEKNYEDAIKIYRRIFELYPEDLHIRTDIANTLYGAGRIEEAEKEFNAILEKGPTDIKLMIRIAELLALRRRYDDAIKMCNRVLSLDPQNSFAKLWLARISSWNMRYTESLKLYGDIISKDPKWVIARREKGRVLGWMRQYQESMREYKKIQYEIAPDEAARLEMLSKDNFYKRFDAAAIKRYKKWLESEPENLEALYDLGQIYGRQMQWKGAKSIYGKILRIIPEHFRAEQALDKVNIYSKSILAETGFEWYEADSGGRDVDKKYYNIYADLKMPLIEDMYLKAREDTFFYRFSNPSSEECERLSFGIEYIKKPLLWASAVYAYNMYLSGLDNTHNFSEEINLRPFDMALFTFTHSHEDVIDNGWTLREKLQRDDYKIRGTLDLNRRLSGGVDYKYSDYNDGNQRDTVGADASCILLYEPTFLKVIYRYEKYKFDESRDSYFSPSSFHFNRIGLEWRHFLNREELFWGANDTYYTLRYEINFEVHDQRGHKLYADFHRDWTDRLSTGAEWSKTIYEEEDTYSEDRLLVSMKYRF